ncbi:hypothetical protein BU26DRAFT_596700 [Trematosphaeria pertusa]|uniref:Uncharacterized protein n=1 Tax=Trematosphaeria pertusa TaxID=390896 RepID=A0A6A6IAH7_9PLEO|nr:uncharacterized protein BU26DRAFT_596700 [Trematosphaeria pertusa]KAF2247058.1 hypothetical protein BU26DRAFT_596700 [Trematosphaeria pertusa]
MKPTAAILSLAFAISGLAAPAPDAHNSLFAREPSNVLLCKNTDCAGPNADQFDLGINTGICSNVPANFLGTISAIAPNGILNCSLFAGADCTGASPPVVTGRVNDLGAAPYNFNDRTASLLCNRK